MAKTPKTVATQYIEALDNDLLKVEKIAVPFTSIVNRAPMVDLSQDLAVRFGINRITAQSIFQIQNESGANGESVFGLVGDTNNQVRFVGSGWTTLTSNEGSYQQSALANDYVEVTFYGTGLNWLSTDSGGGKSWSYSIDGSSLTAIPIAPTAFSAAIGSRNYAPNIIVPIISGLSLGLHTVRLISLNSSGLFIQGFEILNQSSTLTVPKGSYFKDGKILRLLNKQNIPYNSGFESGTLGTKGGRALVYLKDGGDIGKSLTPTDATPLYLTNTNHANEEMIRQYSPREFGAGRSDDFSIATNTFASRAFTLDDGTTTLVSDAAAFSTQNNVDALYLNTANFFTLTFVGTGLDIETNIQSGTATTYTVTVDGVFIGNLQTVNTAVWMVEKIVSGLPYGTHTVKIARSGGNASKYFKAFKVHAPKKPTLPSSAVELGEYYLMADYVAQPSVGIDYIGTGVLRKFCTREMIYQSNYLLDGLQPANFDGGFAVYSTNNGSIAQYTFFGTGISLKGRREVGYANATINIDGSSNFSSNTVSVSGWSFTSSTGALVTNGSVQQGCFVSISGLALGKHTITLTSTSAAPFEWCAFDIITPIHSPKSNIGYNAQNTLPVGSCAIGDLRKLTDKVEKKKNISQAFGVTNSPSTTSNSAVPMADMGVTHSNSTGKIKVSWSIYTVNNGSTGTSNYFKIYINGTAATIGEKPYDVASSNQGATLGETLVFNVPTGTNKIDLYWWTSASTASSPGARRNLTVEEI